MSRWSTTSFLQSSRSSISSPELSPTRTWVISRSRTTSAKLNFSSRKLRKFRAAMSWLCHSKGLLNKSRSTSLSLTLLWPGALKPQVTYRAISKSSSLISTAAQARNSPPSSSPTTTSVFTPRPELALSRWDSWLSPLKDLTNSTSNSTKVSTARC